MSEETSEFGKGFVYSMLLFAKHWWKIQSDVEAYKKIGDEDEAYNMWFYGACDHVMEMEVPESLKETKIGQLGQQFLDLVVPLRLPIGGERKGDKQDFARAFELLEEMAMEIDRHFGAEPIKADWN